MRQIHYSAWLLALFSAVLQIVIFPLPGLYVFSWFALTPLLLALLRARPIGELEVPGSSRLQPASPLQGFLLGYLSGIIFFAGTCYWIFDTMRHFGGLSAPMAALALFLFCCYLGLYNGLFGLLIALIASPRDHRRVLLSAPFVWVAVELARTRVTGFPWNLLGISQVDNIALSRISSWTGVYGVSFEIVLVNVALAAAFLLPRPKRGAMLTAALAAAAVLQAGRLIPVPTAKADREALLVQQNLSVSTSWNPGFFQQTLTELTELSEKSVKDSSGAKVDLVVWPESPAPFFTNDPKFREVISEMARHTNAWVVVGSIGSNAPTPNSEGPIFNSASLVSPSGEWMQRYDKAHLVPFGEYLPFPSVFSFAGGLTKEVGQFEHGVSHTPLHAGGEDLGTFICYESVFPDEVRQFANNGAQVFVNISNDGWYGDSGAWAQHLNQTRMRAIENSRWILSATNTGLTASIDPAGRVTAQIQRKERTTLLAPYALESDKTFYARHGDWFAYACAIISLGALGSRFLLSAGRKKVETSS